MEKRRNELALDPTSGTKGARIQSRTALSPIFATLIILAVVTVLFVPVFIWAAGTSSQTKDSWGQLGETSTELIVIEAVSLKVDQITVYVRNIGITTVIINNVLIQDSQGKIVTYEKPSQLKTYVPGTTVPKESIIQGELIAISISNPGDLNLNSASFVVKVFTQRGVSASYQLTR